VFRKEGECHVLKSRHLDTITTNSLLERYSKLAITQTCMTRHEGFAYGDICFSVSPNDLCVALTSLFLERLSLI
jgi:hypothetical protein